MDQAGMDEAGRIARYAPAGDAEGLLAYGLHRRALMAFRTEFALRQARAPEPAEEAAFLIGEEAPERIEAYRRDARGMIGQQGAGQQGVMRAPENPSEKSPSKQRIRWPFYGQWVEAPVQDPSQPVNWRGLFFRLGTLLLAVVVTAVLLRVLVVRA